MIDINELRSMVNGAQFESFANSVIHSLLNRLEAWENVFGHLGTPDEVGNEWHALNNRLEAAEKDVALKERIIDSLGSELNAVAKERDALRAKIKQMERQEPAALVKWQVGGLVVHIIGDAKAGDILYALPGVAPKLDEIKTALQRALELGQRETWTGARKHPSREDQREEQQCWNKVWSLLDAAPEAKP